MLPNRSADSIKSIIEQVVSAAQAIPLEKDLQIIMEDANNASVRNYYTPDEDERLRSMFATYLRARSMLVESIDSIMPILKNKQNWKNELRTFTVGFTAGCMLVRATKFIIEASRKNPVIWKKLDESELRYNIERKTLTKLYESLSSPKKMLQFHQATKFYEASKDEIMAFGKDSDLDRELLYLLENEIPFIESRKRDFLKLRTRFRAYDIVRRNSSGFKKAMFHVFRLTGSAVAEMKQPLKQSNKNESFNKRVTPKILTEIEKSLQPGDIIVTRHDDAMSNLFLPGYWPHAAFYMGSSRQLAEINISPPSPQHNIIESKKDGVKFRMHTETLHVDHFVILRPNISKEAIAKAITTAASHAGKRYDFLFDFTQADRLACTELIYRAYHGLDEINFSLTERSGRMCIAAEDLLDQAISSEKFEVYAIFNADSENILYAEDARETLKNSYKSQW